MPTARVLLDDAERRLREAGVPSPRVDAELLLAHATGRPRALVRGLAELPAHQVDAFRALVDRRAGREPLQHLTGSAPFRYLELSVGPGVFVPRPGTELLVDAVLAHLAARRAVPSRLRPPGPSAATDPQAVSGSGQAGPLADEVGRPWEDGRLRDVATRGVVTRGDPRDPGARGGEDVEERPRQVVLVDLCTGSGALALALATEVRGSAVLAVEADPGAAVWARRNLEQSVHLLDGIGSTLELIEADATSVAEMAEPLGPLRGLVDAVVTNPPYIPDDAIPRDPEVRHHDPSRALFGGLDGLDVIRLLIGQAAMLLRPGGLLVIEHADVQGDEAGPAGVPGLLRADAAWTDVRDHPDLGGLPRYTTALRISRDLGTKRAAGIAPLPGRARADPAGFDRRVGERTRSDSRSEEGVS